MKHLTFVFILLGSFFLHAEETPELVDLFAINENPGEGMFSYTLETGTVEKIDFGKVVGHYGLGMIFDGKALPEPFKGDFAKTQIIQIALGTLKDKINGRLPQFGAATLIAKKIPKAKTVFKLAVPNSEELKKDNVALLLFSSPSTKLNQTDEEKLKETLFADSGTVTLTPTRLPTIVILKDQGKKYAFYKQFFKTEIDALLSTPFSKGGRKLKGTVEFLYYWPKDKEATALANRIASDSMTSVIATPPKK